MLAQTLLNAANAMIASCLQYLSFFHLPCHFAYFTRQIIFFQLARIGKHFGYKRCHTARYILTFESKCDSSATTTKDRQAARLANRGFEERLLLLLLLLRRFRFGAELVPNANNYQEYHPAIKYHIPM